MSASISPTRCPPPRRASATARFAETVDLPTPPLPDEIARTVPRWGSSTGVGGGGTPPGPGRGAGWRGAAPSAALLASVTLTRTPVTPCTPWTAFRTSRERAGIIAAEQERERDHTIPRHDEVLHHAGREDVVPAARVLELGQCALDARLEGVGRGHSRKVGGDERGGQRRAGRAAPRTQGLPRRPLRISARFLSKAFCWSVVSTPRMSSTSWR